MTKGIKKIGHTSYSVFFLNYVQKELKVDDIVQLEQDVVELY
jgi:hypothetical protein